MSLSKCGIIGPVTMDFKELYMRFVKDSRTHTLKGIQEGPPKVINLHCMEKLIKKGHSYIIAQLHAIQALEATPPALPIDLQQMLDNHSLVFELPKGLSPVKFCSIVRHSPRLPCTSKVDLRLGESSCTSELRDKSCEL